MKLFQESRKGKVKWLSLDVEGDTLISQWGLLQSDKVQEVKKVCKATNVGKANATTPESQAVFEMNAKITIKKKEGYLEWADFENDLESEEVVVTLDELPESFCPCKPISKAPANVLEGADTYGQRKHNGHCVILTCDSKGTCDIFSRRMEKLTAVLGGLTVVKEAFEQLPNDSMVIYEFTWEDNVTHIESPRKVAALVRVKDSVKAQSRYIENNKTGTYKIIPFDALWWSGNFIGHLTHMERHNKLKDAGLVMPSLYTDWRGMERTARKAEWEGFILRTPDERSCISYSLDGKAHREGSWKYKFTKEEDVILYGATMGKSGKHAEVYARFDVRQYNDAGELIHYGYCGTGVLKHDELKVMTKQIDSGELSWPLCAEIEYASRHDDSHFFEFPIIQRIRCDKTPAECVYNP